MDEAEYVTRKDGLWRRNTYRWTRSRCRSRRHFGRTQSYRSGVLPSGVAVEGRCRCVTRAHGTAPDLAQCPSSVLLCGLDPATLDADTTHDVGACFRIDHPTAGNDHVEWTLLARQLRRQHGGSCHRPRTINFRITQDVFFSLFHSVGWGGLLETFCNGAGHLFLQ